jgi:hypothetical protein
MTAQWQEYCRHDEAGGKSLRKSQSRFLCKGAPTVFGTNWSYMKNQELGWQSGSGGRAPAQQGEPLSSNPLAETERERMRERSQEISPWRAMPPWPNSVHHLSMSPQGDKSERQWLRPTTQEAESRRIEVRDQPRQIVLKTLSWKKPITKKRLVEWLKW